MNRVLVFQACLHTKNCLGEVRRPARSSSVSIFVDVPGDIFPDVSRVQPEDLCAGRPAWELQNLRLGSRTSQTSISTVSYLRKLSFREGKAVQPGRLVNKTFRVTGASAGLPCYSLPFRLAGCDGTHL